MVTQKLCHTQLDSNWTWGSYALVIDKVAINMVPKTLAEHLNSVLSNNSSLSGGRVNIRQILIDYIHLFTESHCDALGRILYHPILV
jgi:hypothetical protein